MTPKLLTCALLLLLAPAGFTSVNAAENALSVTPVTKNKDKDFAKPLVKQPTGSPTKTFSVSSFSKVSVGSALHVIIKKGNQHKLAAYGPQELANRLEVKQENGKLQVNYRNENWTDEKDREPLVLVMETPDLTSVDLAGAAKGMVEKFSADEFSFSVSGSAQGQLNASCSKLKLDGSGAAKLEVMGKANELSVDLSGASILQSVDLSSAQTKVEASGASKADVTASGSINVEASGASQVRYKGSPKEVKSDLSGAAKLSKI